MGHIERKQREKEAVRASILDAARKIAVAEGWHSVTIRKIADAIEYTPPIVYEHFENKEDLIKELVLSGFREMRVSLDQAIQTESNPKKILLMISMSQWDFAFNNTELYQLMFSLERPTPNDEIKSSIMLIKNVFMQLTNENKELAYELMFNWICLQNGTISTIMQMGPPPGFNNITPRQIFKNFVERFLNSIP
jgi:AcrR family transcriptional regulator